MPLQHILILSAILFFMGLLGVLTRRNAIMTLASLEIMINAACLNFVAFWRYGQYTDNSQGLLFALFAIAVAAAEAAVGLALVIALYRHYKTVDVEKFRFGLAAATTSTAPASSDSKSASKTTQKQKPQSPKSSGA